MKLFLLCLCSSVLLSAQSIDRAEALWRAHDYESANNEFRALVAAQPKNANYRTRWGQLFYERFNPGEAQKLYQEALSIDPKHAGALLGLAQIYADQFEAKANEYAGKALEADPKLYEAH